MAVGTEVGEQAHLMFPGGVLVDAEPWEHDEAVARTVALMADKSVPAIFEAAFEFDGVRVRVDVLERLGRGRWGIREVKSSAEVKPEHINDVALQTYVVRGNDIRVSSIELVHVDNTYVRRKRGINWTRFFRRVDVSAEVANTLDGVENRVAALFKVMRKRVVPKLPFDRKCDDGCDYFARCYPDPPEDWIRNLPNLSPQQYAELSSLGINVISDIPDDFRLSATQERVRRTVKARKPFFSADLTKALKAFGPPAFYIDFETMSPAIPIYEGTSPYQQVPFQWSLHHLDSNGGLTHDEFLASGSDDPRRAFTETLVAALGKGKEPIIVYSPFERQVLGKMAGLFPDLKKKINAIIDRLADLLPIIRGYVYHPDFHGSFSIKYVLPALVDGLGYDDLEYVADGSAASSTFARLAAGALDEDEDATALRTALLAYCERDTLALVEVHRALVSACAKAG